MARRWRVSLASSPKVLGVVTAAALIIALLITSRSLNGGGGPGPPAPTASRGPANSQAPYKISGKAECPPDWPVLAMSNHTSYPAGHPAKPPATAAAVACYQTAAKATSAGYRPAPLPAGTLEVGGVYLTPTSPSFRASCRQAADRLGFAVPCPGLLPTIPPGLPPPKLCQEPSSCRRGELLGFTLGGFVVPAGYVGAPGMQPYGGLEIWAAPTAVAASRPPVQCQNERRIATPTVHHTPAVLADCPDAQGRPASVLLRWSQQGTFVLLSVLGSSDVNQRLVVTLADHLRLVPPEG
jgi:hypothetical protein